MINEEENMFNAGLILEGGGMRGVYTAGILDFFLDKNIEFSSCYGVSAGAAHCCSYLSKQRDRAFRICIDYIKDRNYASFHNLFTTGDYFSQDFVYNKIPNELNPYDYNAYLQYKGKFFAVVTNCEDGQAEYVKIDSVKHDVEYIRASCSLPFISKTVNINDKEYLDGGIADAIPIKKSVEDGNKKNVVILTREKSYVKKPAKMVSYAKVKYRKFPEFVETLSNRYQVYNDTLDYINQQAELGNIFVIQPAAKVEIGRLEKNPEALRALYEDGYNDGANNYKAMMAYLQS